MAEEIDVTDREFVSSVTDLSAVMSHSLCTDHSENRQTPATQPRRPLLSTATAQMSTALGCPLRKCPLPTRLTTVTVLSDRRSVGSGVSDLNATAETDNLAACHFHGQRPQQAVAAAVSPRNGQ